MSKYISDFFISIMSSVISSVALGVAFYTFLKSKQQHRSIIDFSENFLRKMLIAIPENKILDRTAFINQNSNLLTESLKVFNKLSKSKCTITLVIFIDHKRDDSYYINLISCSENQTQVIEIPQTKLSLKHDDRFKFFFSRNNKSFIVSRGDFQHQYLLPLPNIENSEAANSEIIVPINDTNSKNSFNDDSIGFLILNSNKSNAFTNKAYVDILNKIGTTISRFSMSYFEYLAHN